MQPITCAFAPQSLVGKLGTIPNRKKVAKKSSFFVSGLSEQLQHDDLIKADPA